MLDAESGAKGWYDSGKPAVNSDRQQKARDKQQQTVADTTYNSTNCIYRTTDDNTDRSRMKGCKWSTGCDEDNNRRDSGRTGEVEGGDGWGVDRASR